MGWFLHGMFLLSEKEKGDSFGWQFPRIIIVHFRVIGNEVFLHGEQGYFPSHIVPSVCKSVLCSGRCERWGDYSCRQYPAYATIHSLLIHNGRICICRRGTLRPFLWCWRQRFPKGNDKKGFLLEYGTDSYLFHRIWSWRT